jgi:hypothetical protein
VRGGERRVPAGGELRVALAAGDEGGVVHPDRDRRLARVAGAGEVLQERRVLAALFGA